MIVSKGVVSNAEIGSIKVASRVEYSTSRGIIIFESVPAYAEIKW